MTKDQNQAWSTLRPETRRGSKPLDWTEAEQQQFWNKVLRSTKEKNEPYDRARALSLAGASTRICR